MQQWVLPTLLCELALQCELTLLCELALQCELILLRGLYELALQCELALQGGLCLLGHGREGHGMGDQRGLCRHLGLLHAGRLEVERGGPVLLQLAVRRGAVEEGNPAVGGGFEGQDPGGGVFGAGEAEGVLGWREKKKVLRGAFGGK